VSIGLRLALWYGGLTGLVLALVSLTTYAVHTRAHYDDMDRVLVQATEHIAAESRAAGDDLTGLLRDPIAPDLIVQAYDADGRPRDPAIGPDLPIDPRAILADPAGSPIDWIARRAPSLVDVSPRHGAFGTVPDAAGDRWRVYALHVPERQLYLVAEAPLERIDASVERFRLLVMTLSLAGVGLTLLAGMLLAHRALRPVSTLTLTAAGIAQSRELERRVPLGNDRDELGTLARTFNDMLASLDEAYRAQQRFVSDASHELRAPLTVIQANLDLAERMPDLPAEERNEAIAEAGREARRLSLLVADLLALARADAGVPLQRRAVELDRVLLDAVGDARHLAPGQQVEIDAIEPVIVEGDPDRLKQLLIILLDNAIKYTPASGRVGVALRRDGRHAVVTVVDNGIGIAPADVSRVFERFYRADPARSRDPGGTGLGLPIARWIAQQHGGDVTLSSELGRGTTAVARLLCSA
jgi:signal transduction histidine kinase